VSSVLCSVLVDPGTRVSFALLFHFLSYILFPRWTSYQLRISFLPASIDMFPTFAWFSTPWILHCSAPVYIFAFPLFLGLVWTLVCFSFVLHLLFGGDGVEEAF
jgi:hypothetical protein